VGGAKTSVVTLFVSDQLLTSLEESAHRLSGAKADYDPLIEMIGDARFVLLGEATHGTHEFYKARAEITKRLVEEKGFNAIAWEADWPDALRVQRYVRGGDQDANASEALSGFKRFPTWMWRNADILDLVGWLRNHNSESPAGAAKVGVYGLDLYSLHTSIDAVINYLDRMDTAAAKEARQRYSCFEDFGEDPQVYGMTAAIHRSLSCEEEVVQQLVELQRHASDYLSRDGQIVADELFYAEQNARVAKSAEQYYRAMYRGRPNTWNLRDTYMVDTLENLMRHLKEQGERPKAILWAHNSHLGDARATQMSVRGELNVGQLVRERHEPEAVLVGFTTYSGTVTAASDWGASAERKRVRSGIEDSYELLFHEVGIPSFLLNMRGNRKVTQELQPERLERAIGVIYRPETERWSHYFEASLSAQFDAVIHFDETRAVEPLERTSVWEKGELPETYPSGL
jgi:erythromycin esterase-like protein